MYKSSLMVILFYGYKQRWWLSLDACPLLAHSSFDDSRALAAEEKSGSASESDDEDLRDTQK